VGVLLAGSLAANVLLAHALQDGFAKLQWARIFPLGYVPQSPVPAPAAAGPSIAFWGDSRALMWDKTPLAGRLAVRDHAHGGITSEQLVLQLRTEPPVRSTVAVVQVGINDLHPLGAIPGDKTAALEQLRRNVRVVRDLLLERSDTVVLTTLLPPGEPSAARRLAWDAATPRYVQDINDEIRAAANHPRVLLLDAWPLLLGRDGYLDPRYADEDFFLHVNRAAYSRLNERLQALLQAAPPTRN
jgi:lysophospholipase L1-like esterase